eukprot:m.180128 g.180128  ORF g.180128 m.180128 type:complete len:594 (+) comp14943_c0_seq3:3287-5068(+)
MTARHAVLHLEPKSLRRSCHSFQPGVIGLEVLGELALDLRPSPAQKVREKHLHVAPLDQRGQHVGVGRVRVVGVHRCVEHRPCPRADVHKTVLSSLPPFRTQTVDVVSAQCRNVKHHGEVSQPPRQPHARRKESFVPGSDVSPAPPKPVVRAARTHLANKVLVRLPREEPDALGGVGSLEVDENLLGLPPHVEFVVNRPERVPRLVVRPVRESSGGGTAATSGVVLLPHEGTPCPHCPSDPRPGQQHRLHPGPCRDRRPLRRHRHPIGKRRRDVGGEVVERREDKRRVWAGGRIWEECHKWTVGLTGRQRRLECRRRKRNVLPPNAPQIGCVQPRHTKVWKPGRDRGPRGAVKDEVGSVEVARALGEAPACPVDQPVREDGGCCPVARGVTTDGEGAPSLRHGANDVDPPRPRASRGRCRVGPAHIGAPRPAAAGPWRGSQRLGCDRPIVGPSKSEGVGAGVVPHSVRPQHKLVVRPKTGIHPTPLLGCVRAASWTRAQQRHIPIREHAAEVLSKRERGVVRPTPPQHPGNSVDGLGTVCCENVRGASPPKKDQGKAAHGQGGATHYGRVRRDPRRATPAAPRKPHSMPFGVT